MRKIRTNKGRVPRDLRHVVPDELAIHKTGSSDLLKEEDARTNEQAEEVFLKHLQEHAVGEIPEADDDDDDGFYRGNCRSTTREDHAGDYDEDIDKENYM